MTLRALSVLLALAATIPLGAQNGPKGRVVVYRLKQSGLNEPLVYCDTIEVAQLRSGRYIVLEIPVGNHTFQASGNSRFISVDVKPGVLEYVRVRIGMMGMRSGVVEQVMPEEVGRDDVRLLQPMREDRDRLFDMARLVFPPHPPTPLAVAPPPSNGLTNQDVIQMSQGGLSVWLIIRRISESPPNQFQLGPRELVRLKEAKVSEDVIGAMMDKVLADKAAAEKAKKP